MRVWLLLFVLAALSGCAPATRVTLLPQADGHANAIETKTSKAAQVIDQAYAVAKVGQFGGITTEQTSKEEVQQRHADLLAVQPAPPERFTLYFILGGATLTPESEAALSEILTQAAARPGGEILIIGHTDRVGPLESNDTLSLERARLIRELFIERGFPPVRVHAIGRGEREPAVPTPDEVDEPQNRRAVIVVR